VITPVPAARTPSGTTRAAGIAIALIVAAAALLRFYRLGQYPTGLFCDEAADGFNAYSLLHTAHDEHGRFLPLFIWSFFAFKYPLYIYPTALWVGLLGLTELATRFQSALYGTAGVAVAFLIGRQIFSPLAGIAAAAALAVMPWHFHFSRISFSLTGYAFLFGLAVYYLARALGAAAERRDWILAAVCFALCPYMYAVSQLQVPAFVLCALVVASPAVWRRRRWALQALLVGVLVALPFVVFYFRYLDRASIYVMQTSVFAWPEPLAEKLDIILRQNWPTYLGWHYLFVEGDPILRHGVRNHGVLYTAFVPWIAIGLLASLVRRGYASKLLVLWLVLYPLGAAVTRETPSATRSFLGTMIFAVLAGIGFERVVALARRIPIRAVRSAAIAIVGAAAAVPLAIQTRAYLEQYFVEYPTYAATGIEGFQYGYREIFHIMEEKRTPDTRLFYSTTNVNNPYIFNLFYVHRPPVRTSDWGHTETDYTGVRPMEIERWYDPSQPTLFAALPLDMWFFESWKSRVDVDGPGGVPAFVVLENPKPKHFVEEWELLAPFPNPDNKRRLDEMVDAKTMEAKEPTMIGDGKWHPYHADGGVVELNRYLGVQMPGTAENPEFVISYMRTTVRSPDTRRVVLELIGSRDEMILWLNGRQETAVPLALTESELRKLPLELKPGENLLVLKTIETVGDWWFSARLAKPDGTADPEVRIIANDKTTPAS
jgi:hypothetical protein